MLYVPVVYSDDAPPILGDLPDVTNQPAVANDYFSPQEFGAVYIQIVVDNQVTSLGTGYPVGAVTPLADSPGGTLYTVVAAFLTPLTRGALTVTIRSLFTLCRALAARPGQPPSATGSGPNRTGRRGFDMPVA